MPKRAVAKLRKGRDKRLREGHLWVYAGEIDSTNQSLEPGILVDVISHNGHFLGRGYANPSSQITIRLLTWDDEDIDDGFFVRRVREAFSYRQPFFRGEEAYRVIHGEGDLMPGLVVDKLGDTLVVQVLTRGMEERRKQVFAALGACFGPIGLTKMYERSDVNVRRLEGMEERSGYIAGGQFATSYDIMENGISFGVDVASGQKTGYFLDQKENRRALQPLVASLSDARVLDVFSHTGTFAIHALHYGATHATCIDSSEAALAMAKANADKNSFAERLSCICGNAFDVLRRLERDQQTFDVVILDPPAFTKSKDSVEAAARGYKEINLRGIKLTRPGGFLVTCSCSHHMTKDHLLEILKEAGLDSGRKLRLIETRTQSKDHPILIGMPETEYLKCFIVQVL